MSKSDLQGLEVDPTTDEPFEKRTEPLAQGGEVYCKCRSCGIEVMPSLADHADHRAGCRFA